MKHIVSPRPLAVLVLASILTATSLPVSAQTNGESLFEFLKSAGCSQLPFGACDALDADNAQSIGLTYKATFVEHYCGTRNFAAARQLLETDMALDADACRVVLSIN